MRMREKGVFVSSHPPSSPPTVVCNETGYADDGDDGAAGADVDDDGVFKMPTFTKARAECDILHMH